MLLPLRAILFDLDGTLLDTAPDLVGALNELRLERRLAPLSYDSVRSSVSHGAARLIRLGFPDADPGTFAVLQKRFLEIYAGAVSLETRLFEGMDRVLAILAERGLRCGIVTTRDTVSERKPHAMPMLHAAKLAGVAADECVYVGDAERDIQAAHAAGMPGLVATYGYLQPDEDWRAWGGDGVIQSPLDLLPWLEHSGRL